MFIFQTVVEMHLKKDDCIATMLKYCDLSFTEIQFLRKFCSCPLQEKLYQDLIKTKSGPMCFLCGDLFDLVIGCLDSSACG